MPRFPGALRILLCVCIPIDGHARSLSLHSHRLLAPIMFFSPLCAQSLPLIWANMVRRRIHWIGYIETIKIEGSQIHALFLWLTHNWMLWLRNEMVVVTFLFSLFSFLISELYTFGFRIDWKMTCWSNVNVNSMNKHDTCTKQKQKQNNQKFALNARKKKIGMYRWFSVASCRKSGNFCAKTITNNCYQNHRNEQ